MKSSPLLLSGLAGIFCFVTWACSSTTQPTETIKVSPEDAAKKKWQAHQKLVQEELQDVDSLTNLKAPLLTSSHFQRRWQKPDMASSSAGVYQLSYFDPESSFDNLIIYGSDQPLITFDGPPPPIGGMGTSTPQDWKTVEIMGKKVRYFVLSSGGNSGEMWATEGFSLTTHDGRTGYYRLETEFNTLDAPDRFSKVSW